MYIPLTFEGSQAKCLFATGGYEGYFISGSQQYKYHWFTGSANLEVQKGTIDNVHVYVIGGGGGGARGTANVVPAAGGGGGGTNFKLNAILFQGTYNVSVGAGGSGAITEQSNGFSGVGSSFVGANLNLGAGGGGGGTWGSSGVGGTSGNGFAGGSSQAQNGGGGGGSTAVGNNATSLKAGNGGAGNIFDIAEFTNGFGCGGGGYAIDTADEEGFSCNDTQFGAGGRGNNTAGAGANRFGMGGGGGGSYGAEGGSGSVIIQYPIYDYCTNYFNETGSCGCREITFDTTNQLNYYPQLTGSFIYQPCGENKFVSGSLISYGPLTVCAVSNSYYSYTIGDSVDPIVVQNIAGFATTGPECISASLVPTTCSVESFVPLCSSKIVTIYTPSSSVGSPNDFYYVLPGTTQHSLYSSTSPAVKYICLTNGGSYAGNLRYPQLLTGNNASIINSATCSIVTFTSTVAPGFNRQGKYYDCNGSYQTFSGNGPFSITRCVDRNTFFGFVGPGTTGSTSVTIGGDCFTGSNVPYCGCTATYNIQNCASASVTSSIALSGSLSLSVGDVFRAIGTGLTGSCWSVTEKFEQAPFTPIYNNVITSSTFANCIDCQTNLLGSGSVSWSFTETTQDGLLTIYDNETTLATLSGSGNGNANVTAQHYVTASLTPVNYPLSGSVTMSLFVNGNTTIYKTGSANTTISASFLVTQGSTYSITASIVVPVLIDYLIVGGGGGGGSRHAGGGGAGDYITGSIYLSNGIYSTTVGNGGNGSGGLGIGTNGGNSSVFGLTAIGGGYGGGFASPTGGIGGSGGGALGSSGSIGGASTGSQGFNGGNGADFAGGGGGGASQSGFNGISSYPMTGGAGGSGSAWIDGIFYAGGGGGGVYQNQQFERFGGVGGIGGGGKGGDDFTGSNATPNTGGGGGGAGASVTNTPNGGNGGSGIVKLRYESGSIVNATGGTISVSGSYVYHTFTGSGTFTF